ncbi:MgtC/SapB family protein [Arvimicrobium flavum]|uniref:MgtC/SapB family protein n=1 Tax=Arvimicrobium flavum TaxID=3393320 RepID=UPI00237A44CE|nr:MgtC/SapB family protein [Mesorhizobium shangrilense]
MESIVEEFGHPTFTSFPVIVARLLLAALFGGLIGLEREWRSRPAGLRTHILVCVAAATFGILTIEISHAPMFQLEDVKSAVRFDPIRAVEAITAGIAFLAAGTIMFSKGEVQGLTTGAGMWLAGAIGLAAGFGYWQIAALGTLLVLIVLGLLHVLEVKLDISDDKRHEGAPGEKGAASEQRVAPDADDPSHMKPSKGA